MVLRMSEFTDTTVLADTQTIIIVRNPGVVGGNGQIEMLDFCHDVYRRAVPIGIQLTVEDTSPATGPSTGAIQCSGGGYFGAATYFEDIVSVKSNLYLIGNNPILDMQLGTLTDAACWIQMGETAGSQRCRFGYNGSTNEFQIQSGSGVYTTRFTVDRDTGNVRILSAIPATGSAAAAFVVVGGAGIGDDLFIYGASDYLSSVLNVSGKSDGGNGDYTTANIEFGRGKTGNGGDYTGQRLVWLGTGGDPTPYGIQWVQSLTAGGTQKGVFGVNISLTVSPRNNVGAFEFMGGRYSIEAADNGIEAHSYIGTYGKAVTTGTNPNAVTYGVYGEASSVSGVARAGKFVGAVDVTGPLTIDGPVVINYDGDSPTFQVNADGDAKVRLNNTSGGDSYFELTWANEGTDQFGIYVDEDNSLSFFDYLNSGNFISYSSSPTPTLDFSDLTNFVWVRFGGTVGEFRVTFNPDVAPMSFNIRSPLGVENAFGMDVNAFVEIRSPMFTVYPEDGGSIGALWVDGVSGLGNSKVIRLASYSGNVALNLYNDARDTQEPLFTCTRSQTTPLFFTLYAQDNYLRGNALVRDVLTLKDQTITTAATSHGLKMKVSADPGPWVGAPDTDGLDTYIRTSNGGPNATSNPRGGDLIFILGDNGSGGTGREGKLQIRGYTEITNNPTGPSRADLFIGATNNAQITLEDLSATAGERRFGIINSDGILSLSSVNDSDILTSTPFLSFDVTTGVLQSMSILNSTPLVDLGGGILKHGGLRVGVSTTSGSGTLTRNGVCAVVQTAGGITTTLWASPVAGDTVSIRNRGGAADNTVDGNGTSIEGAATLALADGESATLIFDGTQWTIF